MIFPSEKRNPPLDYHYLMEGTWFWNNYGMDRGRSAALNIRDHYIRNGKLGVCCGIAGNHTQTYGLEEMCRSAYTRRTLAEQWGIESRTMSMIDNNGISWALIAPYAEAGYRNIIFAPNQWNPLPSTVWRCNIQVPGCFWNPDANGGGSRIDVRYDSNLPMVFYWMAPDRESRLLVWCSTAYCFGGCRFGLPPSQGAGPATIQRMEAATAETLPLLESKYPYDLWLAACYSDDEKPNLQLAETFAAWNAKWKFPQFKLLGDPDEPFELLRSRFETQIPTLYGDITGGWYQHPASAPDYLADKFAADQELPTAEKLSVLAALFITAGVRFAGQNFAGAAALSVLVWFVSAPVVAEVFSSVPVAGLTANLVAVPYFAVVFPLIFALSLPPLLGLPLAPLFAETSELILRFSQSALDALASLTPAQVGYSTPLFVLAAAIFCSAAALRCGAPLRRAPFIVLFSLAVLLYFRAVL